MEMRADAQPSVAGPTRRAPDDPPTLRAPSAYLSELRALRKTRDGDAVPIFNPDETAAERDVRIERALAALAEYGQRFETLDDKEGAAWEQVMQSAERPGLALHNEGLDAADR